MIYTRWILGLFLLLTLLPFVVISHDEIGKRIDKLEDGVPLETVLKTTKLEKGAHLQIMGQVWRERESSQMPNNITNILKIPFVHSMASTFFVKFSLTFPVN